MSNGSSESTTAISAQSESKRRLEKQAEVTEEQNNNATTTNASSTTNANMLSLQKMMALSPPGASSLSVPNGVSKSQPASANITPQGSLEAGGRGASRLTRNALSDAGSPINASRDSSTETHGASSLMGSQPVQVKDQFTDYTGADLRQFLETHLNKTLKDRDALLSIEQKLSDFVTAGKSQCYSFSAMSSYHRMFVHRVAALYGLDHHVDQTGKAVIVSMTPHSRLPNFKFKEHCMDVDFPLPTPTASTANMNAAAAVSTQQQQLHLQKPSTLMTATRPLSPPNRQQCQSPNNRQILQRDLSGGSERHYAPSTGPIHESTKSFEDREEDYERARRRIFDGNGVANQQTHLNQNSPQTSLTSPLSRIGVLPLPVSSINQANPATSGTQGGVVVAPLNIAAAACLQEYSWSSADSATSGYATDRSSCAALHLGTSSLMPVGAKAHSFSGAGTAAMLTRQKHVIGGSGHSLLHSNTTDSSTVTPQQATNPQQPMQPQSQGPTPQTPSSPPQPPAAPPPQTAPDPVLQMPPGCVYLLVSSIENVQSGSVVVMPGSGTSFMKRPDGTFQPVQLVAPPPNIFPSQISPQEQQMMDPAGNQAPAQQQPQPPQGYYQQTPAVTYQMVSSYNQMLTHTSPQLQQQASSHLPLITVQPPPIPPRQIPTNNPSPATQQQSQHLASAKKQQWIAAGPQKPRQAPPLTHALELCSIRGNEQSLPRTPQDIEALIGADAAAAGAAIYLSSDGRTLLDFTSEAEMTHYLTNHSCDRYQLRRFPAMPLASHQQHQPFYPNNSPPNTVPMQHPSPQPPTSPPTSHHQYQSLPANQQQQSNNSSQQQT